MASELVDILVKRYSMSVAQAMETISCCGKNKGKKMREWSFKEISWFADYVTNTRNSLEFRICVKAARIVRAFMHQKALERKAVKTDPQYIDSAGRCHVKCLSCEREFSVHTLVFDRRSRPKCFSCGGTIERPTTAPKTEWISFNTTLQLLGVSEHIVRSWCKKGLIKAEKRRGRWLVSHESVQRYLEFGDPLSGMVVCRYCQKPFRSPIAFKLHIDEIHEAESEDFSSESDQ